MDGVRNSQEDGRKGEGGRWSQRDGKKEALLLKIVQMLFRNLKGTYWHLEKKSSIGCHRSEEDRCERGVGMWRGQDRGGSGESRGENLSFLGSLWQCGNTVINRNSSFQDRIYVMDLQP